MLSDNIRKYRKENNMSQDELAEKLGVSRQSISLWETGQTQPTIENIIALSKIFNVSIDAILDNNVNGSAPQDDAQENKKRTARPNVMIIAAAVIVVLACVVLSVVLLTKKPDGQENNNVDSTAAVQTTVTTFTTESISAVTTDSPATNVNGSSSRTSGTYTNDTSYDTTVTATTTVIGTSAETTAAMTTSTAAVTPKTTKTATTTAKAAPQTTKAPTTTAKAAPQTTKAPTTTAKAVPQTTKTPVTTTTRSAEPETTKPKETEPFDLFSYCKEFAIKKGKLNGDYCIYQQPATKYGGYEDEYFSISYWSTYNKVEFCLHCPLSETQSINFYLIMRGGYNKKYEYVSSKYYRSSGEEFRGVSGYIDPFVFSDSYPLGFDKYTGSTDGQNEFIEESRVGMCDLIRLLKKFVKVEKMECDFSDFDFKKF